MKHFLFCLLTTLISLFVLQAQAETYYVKSSENDGSGLSWESPTSLQSALDKAKNGDIIKIAEGTYFPTRQSGHEDWHGPRTKAFLIRENITIEGGYSNNSTEDVDIRNISLYPTILSGVNEGNTSFNVVIIAGPEESERISPTLDGLTITGGYATLEDVFDSKVNVYYDRGGKVVEVKKYCGGGLYNINANPIIQNVIITGNKSEGDFLFNGDGAGVYNDCSSPTFINVLIHNNTAEYDGGGMFNSRESNPKLVNVTITDNYADDGGGIYNQGSGWFSNNGAKPELNNSVVYGNQDKGNNDNIWNRGQGTYAYCLVEGVDVKGNNNLEKNTDPEWDNGFNPQEGSPLINAGSNTENQTLTDLNGNMRINQHQIDIGAYEYQYRPVITIVYDDEDIKVEVTSEHEGEGNIISVTEGDNLQLSMTSVNEKITYNYGITVEPETNSGTVEIEDNNATIHRITGDVKLTITTQISSIEDREVKFVFKSFPDNEEKPQIQVGGEYVSNPYKLQEENTEVEFTVAFPAKYGQFTLTEDNFKVPEGIDFKHLGSNKGKLTNVENDIEVVVNCKDIIVNEYDLTINTDDHTSVPAGEGVQKVKYGEAFSFEVVVDEGFSEIVKMGDKELVINDGKYSTGPITSHATINVSSKQKTYTVSFVNGIEYDSNPIETYLTITDEEEFNREKVEYNKSFKFKAALKDEYSQTLFKVLCKDENDAEISFIDSEGVYLIENITSNITVGFIPVNENDDELDEWSKNKYLVNVKNITGITFSCKGAGNHEVFHGDEHTVSFTLQSGYRNCFKNVKIYVDNEECHCTPEEFDFSHSIKEINCHKTVEIRGVVRDYTPSPSTYLIELPEVEGLIITPKPGGHIVTEGDEFQFELILEAGYVAPELLVKTDREETLTPRESDGKYVISNIESDVKVIIEGVEKYDPTGNAEINEDCRIYVQESVLFIEMKKSVKLSILTMDGKIHTLRRIEAGLTSIHLTQGVYIVQVDDVSYKLYIR